MVNRAILVVYGEQDITAHLVVSLIVMKAGVLDVMEAAIKLLGTSACVYMLKRMHYWRQGGRELVMMACCTAIRT